MCACVCVCVHVCMCVHACVNAPNIAHAHMYTETASNTVKDILILFGYTAYTPSRARVCMCVAKYSTYVNIYSTTETH